MGEFFKGEGGLGCGGGRGRLWVWGEWGREGQVVGLGGVGEGGAVCVCVWGGDFNGASSGEKTSNLCKFRFVIFRIILVS